MDEIIRGMFIIKGRHQELRAAQIISIAANKGGWKDNDTFYCQDEVLKQGFKRWLSE